MDLDKLLDNSASTGTKNKKSETPVMTVGNKEHLESMSKWLAANKAIDANEAIKDKAEEELIPVARAFHAKNLAGLKEAPATVKLVAPIGNIMVDIAKNQYKKVPTTDKEKLAAIFDPQEPGKEVDSAPTPNTNKLFAVATEIKLTADALADSEILTKLVKAVGEENFRKYFAVERNLVPTVAFHHARFFDTDLMPKIQKAIDQGLITPYSPSFKAKA